MLLSRDKQTQGKKNSFTGNKTGPIIPVNHGKMKPSVTKIQRNSRSRHVPTLPSRDEAYKIHDAIVDKIQRILFRLRLPSYYQINTENEYVGEIMETGIFISPLRVISINPPNSEVRRLVFNELKSTNFDKYNATTIDCTDWGYITLKTRIDPRKKSNEMRKA